jgi:PEP-CTERM motif
VLALDFEIGTLYGVTNDSKLISIDTTTGVGTLVANEIPAVRLFAAATADPVAPEPSTFVLAIAGLAGLGFAALRKKFRRA